MGNKINTVHDKFIRAILSDKTVAKDYFQNYLPGFIANKESLSIIIPVLLYHGKGKWRYQTLLDLFKNPDGEWEKFLPNFDYIYNNLGVIPDEHVEALNNK